MAYNTVFHIISAKMIQDYTEMDESDFYDNCEALGADRVSNRTAEDAKEDIERLAERLRKAGFEVTPEEPLEDGTTFYRFKTGDKVETLARKAQYFEPAYTALKRMVSETSLEAFASDGLEEYKLRMLIDNKGGDMVFFGDCIECVDTLDSFIRKLEPNREFYIAPETVYLH